MPSVLFQRRFNIRLQPAFKLRQAFEAQADVLHDAFVASVSHDVREFASRITQPTLLIAAERDDITPIEAERELARLFANAALVEIADVGHLIHYETPAPAAAAIRTFLGLDEPDTR